MVLKIAVRRRKDFGGATILAALGIRWRVRGLLGALPYRSLSVCQSVTISAGKSRAQAREDRERAQARAREPWTVEPYEL